MDAQHLLEVVVTIWGTAMAVSPGLQVRRMLQTGESEDVSLGYFGVLVVGFLLWMTYGLSKQDYIIAVPNAIATVFGVATIVVALRLRRRTHPGTPLQGSRP